MNDQSTFPRGPVILVENDSEARQQITDVLGAEGFRVLAAADGGRALRIAEGSRMRKREPVLVLVNVILYGMSGYEIVRRFSERYKSRKIPIVMLSPYDSPEDRLEAREAGAAGLLKKPVSWEALEQLLADDKERQARNDVSLISFDINYK